MQFDETQIQCLHTVVRQVQTQELTQEIRLTDGMPDVGRVIASWGQPIIRGKEWRSNGMQVSGGVMAWTLYMPEDGGEVQCLESWLPFQIKWDFQADRDGTICAMPLLQGVDARCLSSRKLMVRAGVSVLGEAVVTDCVSLYNPGELPTDIQLLRKTVPMQIPKEAGEKQFPLDMEISLPVTAPALEKIVGYDLRFELRETKLVGDKLVFRGAAIVHLRYMGADSQLHSWDLEVPFSQYAELEQEHDETAAVSMCFAVTGLELDRDAEENLTLKANVIGQYVIYDQYPLEIVVDAYSPRRQLQLQMGELNLPAVLSLNSETVEAEATMQTQCAFGTEVTFYPEHPRTFKENGKLYAQLMGTAQLLGYDAQGELCANTSRWAMDHPMEMLEQTDVDITINPVEADVLFTAEGANVQGRLRLDITAVCDRPIPMVIGLDIGDLKESDPNRPGIILCRRGARSLWELAKQFGSTEEMIQNTNSLQKDPDRDQMLIIPIL